MFNSTNTTSRQPKRKLPKLAVAATVACLAVASSVAHGAETDSRTPQDPAPQGAETVDVSVVSYAAEYSVSQQEAKRRLDRIQPIQGILAEIRAHEAVRLAGWGIDHTGTFTGWVWLTGDAAPSPAATNIAAEHSDVEIRTGAVHSLAALLEAQQGFFDNLRGTGPVGRVTDGPGTISEIERITTFTDVDMRDNVLEIGIDPALARKAPASPLDPDGLTSIGPVGATDEALQTKIAQVTHYLKDHINVKYTVTDGRGLSDEASFSAGIRIGDCTAGFAARKSVGGAYGIITAGHCEDDGPNDTTPLTMNGVSLPHDFGWASASADAQFHTIPTGSGHVLTDNYLCHASRPINYCDVTGTEVRNRMMNDFVCHTGKASGVSCGNITSINFQPNDNSVCMSLSNRRVDCQNIFVEVESNNGLLRSCDGDSGGPWYRNGVAYGIHKGSLSEQDNCYTSPRSAFFSAIGEVMRFLGVRIILAGDVTIR
ncbi:MAG: hypothetical protein OXD37_09215 [Acidimicrobiaceae bacterium]|nr:hypothetical protein [Acidimicrobiaceae bacterium]